MGYLENSWYVAAWASEVSEGGLLGRTILDRPVLIFRDDSGEAHAIGNRCPHRFAPLHAGRHLGNVVECGYHGLQFDGSGRCVHNPHGSESGLATASVPRYPLIERYGALWIWVGQAQADDSMIPQAMQFMSDPARKTGRGMFPVEANYMLLVDNLMDLSHGMYLHRGNLSSPEMLKNYRPHVTLESDAVVQTRESYDVPIPSLWLPGVPSDQKRATMLSHLRWDAPASVMLDIACAPVGSGRGDAGTITGISGHMFTPETELRTHYFWSFSRDFALGSADAERHVTDTVLGAFIDEDKPMIEAQQKLMGTPDLMSLNPILLKTDNAAIRVRRQLSRMMAEEQQAEFT